MPIDKNYKEEIKNTNKVGPELECALRLLWQQNTNNF